MLAFVLAVALALIVSFLCSVSEAVLLSVSHAQIEALGKSRAAAILRRFKKEFDEPISAILIVNTIANTIGASVAGATFGAAFNPAYLWAFSIAFAVAILLFGEIVPKTMGVAFVDRLAPAVAHFVAGLVFFLSLILWFTRGISRWLRRGTSRPITSIEEIRLLVSLGRTEGAVGARTATMIEGAASLRELTAYDLMVPRGGVRYLSGKRTLEENLRVVRATGHSRFPFAPTGDLDHITGVVLAKELMFQLRETPDDPSWETHLASLLVVPSSMKADRLLKEFQDKRRHLAVVVDEYGGTQGICTLEDVLEEIVGEIEDESDRVDPTIVRRDDVLVCRGWAETRKVFELLGLEDESDAVTIGGFVAEQLRRLPKVGDTLLWGGFHFRVTAANQRRAERVEIGPLPKRRTLTSQADMTPLSRPRPSQQ